MPILLTTDFKYISNNTFMSQQNYFFMFVVGEREGEGRKMAVKPLFSLSDHKYSFIAAKFTI